jgi:hypothetical protein
MERRWQSFHPAVEAEKINAVFFPGSTGNTKSF